MKAQTILKLPGRLGLKTQLVAAYLLLVTIPLFFFGLRYYDVSKKVVADIVQTNVYEIVKKNNEIMDTKLLQVTESILSLLVDKDLYRIFQEIRPEDEYLIQQMDRQIAPIMDKYFSRSLDIYSAQLATSYHTFIPTGSVNSGSGKNFIPSGSLKNTLLYQEAIRNEGKLAWIPTYNFSDMFDAQFMKDANIDYRYMFSVVESVNSSYFDGTVFNTFSPEVERPVLIVNFKEEFFHKALPSSLPVGGSYFFVVTKDGQYVSHKDELLLGTYGTDPWLKEMAEEGSGTKRVSIDGRNMILCFDTSKVTGWISVVAIPPDQLLGEIWDTMKSYLLYSALFFVIVTTFTSYFVTDRITKPIHNLLKAIKLTGEGNFDIRIKETGSRELSVLSSKFIDMNAKIQRLIEENYESKIKEKEAEITALNLQLDPHFMYNTLNLINLISVENEQDEISEMIVSLSTMMKYTAKAKKDPVPFKDDWDYLQSYIFIMTKRFEGRFTVEYDMDPGLYAYGVPKFMLQPFVENAFVHGFDSMKSGGILKVSGWFEEDARLFRVDDNGRGMPESVLRQLLNEENGSVGIQNVDKRIRIIYGERYGVQIESEEGLGTSVTIRLPKD